MATKITITMNEDNVDSATFTAGTMLVESETGRLSMSVFVRLDTSCEDAEIIIRKAGEPTVEKVAR